MRELAESMETMTHEIQGLRSDLGAVVDVLARERWWRKVAAFLVLMGFLSVTGFISYSRQTDCDRTNRSREQIRQMNVTAFGTAWDQLVPADPVGRAELLSAIAEDQESSLPPRDCAWPT